MTEETQTPEAVQAPESKPLICSACGELGYYVSKRIRRDQGQYRSSESNELFAVRCDRAFKHGGPLTICCETQACPKKEQAAERWFKLHDNKA